jgi:hypothetical protein
MQQRSENNRAVVDLLTYRKTREMRDQQIAEEMQDAEEAINEIARHLLQAVRIITKRRQ